MKREPHVNPLKHHVYIKIHAWFKWNKCKECGQEFIRENGWKIWALNYMCHPSYWFDPYYLCGDCIKNEEELIECLKAEENRLKCPPKHE